MSREQKWQDFDPNGIAEDNGNLYGLPYDVDDAALVIVPVPWEVTVSYAGGTADGPTAMLEASKQVDLYDPYVKDAWKLGLAMLPISDEVRSKSDTLRPIAESYIEMFSEGQSPDQNAEMADMLAQVNQGSEWLNHWVESTIKTQLDEGKMVALLGGDHSTPLGMMKALASKFDDYGILQIDAHADLRDAYEGFTYSHASIMFNALKIPQVSALVQVGIRDYCEAENVIIESDSRVHTFFDHEIKNLQYAGYTWHQLCANIVEKLPQNVYLSFDIDGLDPKLCPNTGTPVPGGFEFEQVLFLIREVIAGGRKIIAFDINEVAPGEDEWDANVGARLLYRIANLVMAQE
jgi:agmatinase